MLSPFQRQLTDNLVNAATDLGLNYAVEAAKLFADKLQEHGNPIGAQAMRDYIELIRPKPKLTVAQG